MVISKPPLNTRNKSTKNPHVATATTHEPKIVMVFIIGTSFCEIKAITMLGSWVVAVATCGFLVDLFLVFNGGLEMTIAAYMIAGEKSLGVPLLGSGIYLATFAAILVLWLHSMIEGHEEKNRRAK